uniref:Transketolase domain protein n=1 Tax=Geobacter sp. (strain M21) TaxID=443144 RepID=C6E4X6_GEOSM
MTERKLIKKSIIHMVHRSRSSHVGSCLSVADILYLLYFKIMNVDPERPNLPGRDRLILSKGHASAALYATLAQRGYFPQEYLERFYVDGGLLPGHLDMDAVPGVDASAGSLGHGLSLGIGMAIAQRGSASPGRVFVILGDGECNEGSVWEGVMLASTLGLSNLTAIVDYNKLQSFGRTNNVINQANMSQRWESFGWEACDVDGHDLEALEAALQKPQSGPRVLVAHTVKGKGVSFMEDRLEWHYKSPNDDQLEQALTELEGLA